LLKTSRALAHLAGGRADGTWHKRLGELARCAWWRDADQATEAVAVGGGRCCDVRYLVDCVCHRQLAVGALTASFLALAYRSRHEPGIRLAVMGFVSRSMTRVRISCQSDDAQPGPPGIWW